MTLIEMICRFQLITYFIILLLSTGITIYSSNLRKLNSNEVEDIEKILLDRLEMLKKIGDSVPRPPCQDDNIIHVEDYPYGRSGNNMLELVHGLWMAQATNATLKIPHFIRAIINPFRSEVIIKNFCATFYSRGRRGYIVKASELLNIWMIFKEPKFKDKGFPPLTHEVIQNAASLFLRVMSSLWGHPSEEIKKAAIWFIKNKLGNSLKYTTVHKRYMEGECPDIYRRMSNKTDFDPKELPMDHPSWEHLSNISHPICSMDYDFVTQIQNMSHRNKQQMFLAYDGYGNIDAYRHSNINVALSTDLDFTLFPTFRDIENCEKLRKCHDNRKFLDMFLAIHGDFFILNPRSTYSWYVYVVRTALGLKSVPTIRNRDLLFYSDEDYEKLFLGKRWVGQLDVIEAKRRLENVISNGIRVD